MVPPCGAGFLVERRMFLSARTERNQRCAKGTPSMSADPRRALIGVVPLDPYLRERATLVLCVSPACKIKTGFPPTLGPQGPFAIKICKLLLLLHTAWCLPTCSVRWWSYKRTQQLPSCHGYARVGGVLPAQYPPNFAQVGACAPRQVVSHVLFLPAG